MHNLSLEFITFSIALQPTALEAPIPYRCVLLDVVRRFVLARMSHQPTSTALGDDDENSESEEFRSQEPEADHWRLAGMGAQWETSSCDRLPEQFDVSSEFPGLFINEEIFSEAADLETRRSLTTQPYAPYVLSETHRNHIAGGSRAGRSHNEGERLVSDSDAISYVVAQTDETRSTFYSAASRSGEQAAPKPYRLKEYVS